MENKHNKAVTIFLVVVIVLLIAGLGVMTYFVINLNKKVDSLNTSKTNNQNVVEDNKQESNKGDANINTISKKYNIDDYVKIVDVDIYKNVIDKNSMFLKSIEFSNLPLGTYSEFRHKNKKFLSPSAVDSDKYTFSNEIVCEVYENVLSICETDKWIGGPTTYDFYSLNIDLEKQKIMTNQELLKKCDVKSTDMFNKILNNIANTVTLERFLLDTEGNISADGISIEDFKNNINTYSNIIDNRYDLVTLFVENGKLKAKYTQNSVLEALGMGTHMGKGITSEPQTIELN